MSVKLYLFILAFLFSGISMFACDVSYNTVDGEIRLSGLTTLDNTKIFDEHNNLIWECNPWSSPCSDSEVISGLQTGTTYFLSVVSEICQEWIPITVEGGSENNATCTDGIQNQDETGIDCGGSNCPPCASECNITVTNFGNTLETDGLTADVNAKLFDTDFNIIFQCDPWNGNPCTDITIPDLEVGNYFFSAVSDLCNEYIPLTIESGDVADCQTTLENWEDTNCFTYNEDGSFSTRIVVDDVTIVEHAYSSSGTFLGSSFSTIPLVADLTLSEDAVIFGTDANGVSVNIFNESFINTYSSGNNFFSPTVGQAANGDFYIIGVIVGEPFTNESFSETAIIDIFVHQIDPNGNEVASYNFHSFPYNDFFASNISEKFTFSDIILLADGSFDIFYKISWQIHLSFYLLPDKKELLHP